MLPKNGGDFSNNTQPLTKVPAGVILVKGAWSSASDSVTPVPEGGNVTNNVFRDQYFGMSYALPKDWTEKYKGPPPSDSGRYVLAQIRPADTFKGPARGSYPGHRRGHVFHHPARGQRARTRQLLERQFAGRLQSGTIRPRRPRSPAVPLPSLLIGLRSPSCIGMFWRPKSAATRWKSC